MSRFPGAPRGSYVTEPVTTFDLHELACSGPTPVEGCVCRPAPKGSVALLDMHRVAPDWQVADYASRSGIDIYLSSLESVLIALEQRQLDSEQLDRFARLLQQGERMALARARRRRP